MYTHCSNFFLCYGDKQSYRFVWGVTFPHHSALLCCLFVLRSKAETQQGVSDVYGNGSQRRGAVANFMPCIFPACMTNSQFRPVQWQAHPVISHTPPPLLIWVSRSEAWAIRAGLANPYFGLLSYRANSDLIKTKEGTRVAFPFGFATLDCLCDVNDYPPHPLQCACPRSICNLIFLADCGSWLTFIFTF